MTNLNGRCPSTGKVPHYDRKVAKRIAKRLRLSLYRCVDPRCGAWHVGHKPSLLKTSGRAAQRAKVRRGLER